MAEVLKIKIDFSDYAKEILHFITETQEGKYTEKKPDLIQIERLQIEEAANGDFIDVDEENLLLGII